MYAILQGSAFLELVQDAGSLLSVPRVPPLATDVPDDMILVPYTQLSEEPSALVGITISQCFVVGKSF